MSGNSSVKSSASRRLIYTPGGSIPPPPPGGPRSAPPGRPRSTIFGSPRVANPIHFSTGRVGRSSVVNPGPRIGGGNDSDSWWTGGPNVKVLQRPVSANARRPRDLKSLQKAEEACTTGLSDSRQLGTEDDRDNTITFNSWISEIRRMLENRGLDTVFYVKEPFSDVEHYIPTSWGEVDMAMVKKWVKELKTGVTTSAGSKLAACLFDLENLDWSARVIK